MNRTLVVTNDFPPRPGGIQTFVHQLAIRQPAGSIVVYASSWPGAEEFDRQQPFPVIRHPSTLLVPTPAVRRQLRAVVAEHEVDTVWFGAAAPLGLLAPGLRQDGVRRAIASTHGHETGWAKLPGGRQALRRIARDLDVLTYLGDYTRTILARAVGERSRWERLPPGVDVAAFHPKVDGSPVRERLGLAGRPTVVCVSRLVPRKGQDVLIRALPRIHQRIPDAAVLLVGGGPDMPRLQRLAAEQGVADDVVFTGSVPWEALPAHFAAGDAFAMPCRTRRGGLDVEGLGIVFLEASATGLPVVAGDSGGAPEAVRDGETGYVVPGRSVPQVADRLTELLADPGRARAMGLAGREWVEREWSWDVQAAILGRLLAAGSPAES